MYSASLKNVFNHPSSETIVVKVLIPPPHSYTLELNLILVCLRTTELHFIKRQSLINLNCYMALNWFNSCSHLTVWKNYNFHVHVWGKDWIQMEFDYFQYFFLYNSMVFLLSLSKLWHKGSSVTKISHLIIQTVSESRVIVFLSHCLW